MRWQRIAQAAIALFVIGFIAVLVTTLRRETAAPGPQQPPPVREIPDAAVENPGGCQVINAAASGRVFSIKCGKHFTFPDGRHKFTEGVEVAIDRGGRDFVVRAKEADVTQKGDLIDKAVFKGDVRFTGGGGLAVKSEEATYSDSDGIVNIPGPVEFTKGRMTGSGVGATYDRTREVLWLLKQARVNVAADPKTGQGGIEGTAGSIGLARADRFVRLLGDGRLSGEGRIVQADDLVIRLAEDGERVQSMELRGNSRITGGAGGPQSMSARDIDLAYGEDGRTLQNAHLTENAVVQLAGAGAGKRIAANEIDITLGPDGSSVTNLTATQRVQVDLPGEGASPAKRITSATLIALGAPGAGGLQNATFTGSVEYREIRAGRAKTPAGERTARSDSLVVNTKPGFGAVERADFRGNVTFTEGTEVTAYAPQALYYVDRDRLELMPGEGLPGRAPQIIDSRLSVTARAITFTIGTREMNADTKVRSTILPQKKGAPAGGTSKLPSMLDDDEQVNVTANRLTYKGSGSSAVYAGAAQMWQGNDTTIKADTITVDDKTGNLTATGGVTTLFSFEEVDKKTNTRERMQTTGNAERFTYDDARRVATYTGKAHINGPQGDVTGERIELYTKAGVNELERAEAYGPGLVVIEGKRRVTGTHLTYTAADERYLIVGTPVEIIEAKSGACTQMLGASATFSRTTEAVNVEGIPGRFPTETKTLPKCPAGMKG